MEILFLHGAGGWDDDQLLVVALRRLRAAPVHMPRLPADDFSASSWVSEVRHHREVLGPGLVVVGHSFGASMALLDLATSSRGPRPAGLVLLAMPSWSERGWDVEDYVLPSDVAPPSDVPILLAQCRDDPVVPIEHLEEHRDLLPGAAVRTYDTGGHQFTGRMAAVAQDIEDLVG